MTIRLSKEFCCKYCRLGDSCMANYLYCDDWLKWQEFSESEYKFVKKKLEKFRKQEKNKIKRNIKSQHKKWEAFVKELNAEKILSLKEISRKLEEEIEQIDIVKFPENKDYHYNARSENEI